MCGRYAATANPDELVEEYEVDEVTGEWAGPSWNVAPTVAVPAVLERADKQSGDVRRRLAQLRWGLVPSWSKDLASGARMINARVETVAEKPAFRKAFAARRCLLPADGYYEWYASEAASGGKPRKQPFFIHRADGRRLSMAGIYEFWRNPAATGDEDPWVVSCSVITTTATDAVGHIHDRMPMVVAEAARQAWLDPALTDPQQALELLSVTEPELLEAYAVLPLVSNVRNDGPELLTALDEAPAQQAADPSGGAAAGPTGGADGDGETQEPLL
ncbi:SOS response-associated peptidase [Auraticoccus monumenti]|uniref:Abasic site processing protein n=1 Tax=Auraticoccus monumenti TaxID=675864 RepID=A0A1G7AU54_9ACTN|nr:SOS response-associated peptidase [Auraticoccus monumenti]SDE18398.1 Putative SOS response-associated peptidase YedK [Auraticoccus monumenti]